MAGIWTNDAEALIWDLDSVTAVANTNTWSIGTTLKSCPTAASTSGGLQTCTATASATVSAGTIMSISTTTNNSTAAGAIIAFSCQ